MKIYFWKQFLIFYRPKVAIEEMSLHYITKMFNEAFSEK